VIHRFNGISIKIPMAEIWKDDGLETSGTFLNFHQIETKQQVHICRERRGSWQGTGVL
jgi:hypothetical protein